MLEIHVIAFVERCGSEQIPAHRERQARTRRPLGPGVYVLCAARFARCDAIHLHTRTLMPDYHKGTDLLGRPRRRLRALVLERDSYRCHLCGLPVRMDVDQRSHPLAAAVDELIPRSPRHGGGNPLDPNNCRCSHRRCNGVRGTRPVTPALQAECRRQIEAILAGQAPTIHPW